MSGQKSAGPLNSTLGKFGNYSRGVVFSRGCKPLLSFWPWLSYCFIMAFLKWKNSRVSPHFCPVVLRGRAARVFHRACLGGEPPSFPRGGFPAGRAVNPWFYSNIIKYYQITVMFLHHKLYHSNCFLYLRH